MIEHNPNSKNWKRLQKLASDWTGENPYKLLAKSEPERKSDHIPVCDGKGGIVYLTRLELQTLNIHDYFNPKRWEKHLADEEEETWDELLVEMGSGSVPDGLPIPPGHYFYRE